MNNKEILDSIKSRLPRNTQYLISALGWDATLSFMKRHSGRYLYFPNKFDPSHNLYNGLSEQQSRNLYDRFGGHDHVHISNYRKMLASERYNDIYTDFVERGFDQQMLQEKYGMPRQTIQWIIDRFDFKPISGGKK